MEDITTRHIEFKKTDNQELINSWKKDIYEDIERLQKKAILCIHENGILYSRIDPKHLIEDIVAEMIAEDHPLNIVVLESRRGCFISRYGHSITAVKGRMENVMQKLGKEINGLDHDILDFGDDAIAQLLA